MSTVYGVGGVEMTDDGDVVIVRLGAHVGLDYVADTEIRARVTRSSHLTAERASRRLGSMVVGARLRGEVISREAVQAMIEEIEWSAIAHRGAMVLESCEAAVQS